MMDPVKRVRNAISAEMERQYMRGVNDGMLVTTVIFASAGVILYLYLRAHGGLPPPPAAGAATRLNAIPISR
jgi:hypothetical protein